MKKERGFTLYIAMVIMGTLFLVASALIGLAVKQARIASASKESQYAFYAADTGMECALYWDVKNPTGISAFSTTTGSTISCNGSTAIVGGSSQSIFSYNLSPDPYCVFVIVTKNPDNTTRIESLGYNTCDVSNPRRVERSIEAVY